MKAYIILVILIMESLLIYAQSNRVDTNYNTRIVSAEWMPDGKSILVAVVKFHKTDQQAPFFSKVFQYHVASGQLNPLFANGSSLNPSDDGRQVAFLKRDDPKRVDVYVYDMKTKRETLLKTDTMRKSAMAWSPDGKKLAYNISPLGHGPSSPVEICVFDFTTGLTKQVTQSGKDKSYSPSWSPDSKKIVYYLEKGDGHDQIWMTDATGSFHTNVTNDASTHNYFPSWMDNKTIIYTQSPASLMMISADGTNRKKIDGVNSTEVKYNSRAKKFLYVLSEDENKVLLFDTVTKKEQTIVEGSEMISRF